jgi:hypothetical protein
LQLGNPSKSSNANGSGKASRTGLPAELMLATNVKSQGIIKATKQAEPRIFDFKGQLSLGPAHLQNSAFGKAIFFKGSIL